MYAKNILPKKVQIIVNFNYGQAQLMEGNYEEAEKTLRSVKNHLLTSELSYRKICPKT